MVYTSYFSVMHKFPCNTVPISISLSTPRWYKGLQYKRLAPPWHLLKYWKTHHDEEYYKEVYTKEVLDRLSMEEIFADIYGLLLCTKYDIPDDWLTNPNFCVILLCWEKPSSFCHRHLAAKKFEAAGIECKEFDFI